MSTRALTLAGSGEHDSARELFLRALDGLEYSLGFYHGTFIDTLTSYMEFCLSQGHFDEAERRMRKSWSSHLKRFGERHSRTLKCLARLGNLYRLRKQYCISEIALHHAKFGLEELYTDNSEGRYLHTAEISAQLIDVHKGQGHYDEVEEELRSLIMQTESLNGQYQEISFYWRYELAFFYYSRMKDQQDPWWRAPPLVKIESFNLESIEVMEHSPSGTSVLCLKFYELLRWHYNRHLETAKLATLLVKAVNKLSAVSRATTKQCKIRTIYRLKRSLIESYVLLGDFKQAKWWLDHLQSEAKRLFGPESHEVFEIVLSTAIYYLVAGDWDQSVHHFKDAQRRGEKSLNLNDPRRQMIPECLERQTYANGCFTLGQKMSLSKDGKECYFVNGLYVENF